MRGAEGGGGDPKVLAIGVSRRLPASQSGRFRGQSCLVGGTRRRDRSPGCGYQYGYGDTRGWRAEAGEEGFEPSNGGSKVRCLTTWRLPRGTTDRSRVEPSAPGPSDLEVDPGDVQPHAARPASGGPAAAAAPATGGEPAHPDRTAPLRVAIGPALRRSLIGHCQGMIAPRRRWTARILRARWQMDHVR